MTPAGATILVGLVVLGLAGSATIQGQSTPDAFEVASVKPNKSGKVLGSLTFQPGGRFTATNVTLRELIRAAYGIQNVQLAGGPDWIGSERFDIAAKAEGQEAPSPLMLRTLLAERFKLTTHNEIREMSLYELVVARSDRRLGPQLRESQVDCVAAMAAVRARGGPPPVPPDAGAPQVCDMFVGIPPRFAAEGVSMAELAMSLSRIVGRVVVDRTELVGLFDFELQWTPELPQRPTGIFRLNGFDVDPDGPSIFTALQEQLGLKLESGDGPVDVLFVDDVERPTPD